MEDAAGEICDPAAVGGPGGGDALERRPGSASRRVGDDRAAVLLDQQVAARRAEAPRRAAAEDHRDVPGLDDERPRHVSGLAALEGKVACVLPDDLCILRVPWTGAEAARSSCELARGDENTNEAHDEQQELLLHRLER